MLRIAFKGYKINRDTLPSNYYRLPIAAKKYELAAGDYQHSKDQDWI